MELIAYALIGITAGLSSGMLGIGGGIIIVPTLMFAFKYLGFPSTVLMQTAAGTYLASVVITNAIAFRSHLHFGFDSWEVLRKMFLGIIIGTILGSTLAHFLHSDILRKLFGLYLAIISIFMLFEFELKNKELPNKIALFFISIAIGSFSGLLGLAGGTLIIPFLLSRNVAIRNAITIALACGFVIALAGTTGYMIGHGNLGMPKWSTGYVYWPAFICILSTSPVFSILGAKWSHRLPAHTLKKIFIYLLLIMAIKMVF